MARIGLATTHLECRRQLRRESLEHEYLYPKRNTQNGKHLSEAQEE